MDALREILANPGFRSALAGGLRVTVGITLGGLALGTVLAMPLCAARRARCRGLRFPAAALISVLRGSPVLLLLMLLYYVVLARTTWDAATIAILAFGLNASAHIAEIMRTALDAADPMQAEAARMLGMNAWQAFRLITLPQALDVGLPVYQNAVVNLLQWTSVVGYVAIADLTRVVNNIGMRAANPFLALFLGMATYLLAAYAANGIFALVARVRRRGPP